MSQLVEIIQPQNFELIRDRIAAILLEELGQQLYMGSDVPSPTFFIERTVPFDKTDLPAVNVAFAGGNFGNKDVRAADGTYSYNIDSYISAPSTDDAPGDVTAALQLQRIMGVLRAIIEAPCYRTLDFEAPSISRVFVQDISIADPGRQDATSTLMGRLVLVVRVPENMELKTAATLQANYTAIKLNLTDKGYRYEYNR